MEAAASSSRKRGRPREEEIEHLTSIKDISMPFVLRILRDAAAMKALVAASGGDDRLSRRVLACIFYEPSTRTHCSFQVAMLRLGGKVINVNEVLHIIQHTTIIKIEIYA
jgi:aspartate carbamoyltransferase catalytic subunit